MADLFGSIIGAISALAATAAVFVALYIHRAEQRPDIVVYLEANTDVGSIMLVVANKGNSSARDVRVEEFDSEMCMPDFRPVALRGFVERGIPCLAPNAERRTTIAETRWMSINNPEGACDVVVRYKRRSMFGRLVDDSEVFPLDFYSFSNAVYTMSDLYLIRRDIERMRKSLESIVLSERTMAGALAAGNAST